MQAVSPFSLSPHVIESDEFHESGVRPSPLPLAVVWAGIAAMVLAFTLHLGRSGCVRLYYGHNDFLSFYAGGKLAGSAGLYNPKEAAKTQVEFAGATGPALAYIRLPFFAFLIRPLTCLSYQAAYAVWQLFYVAALVAAIYVLPVSDRRLTTLAFGTSVPLYYGVLNGQDVAFVVFFIACGLRLLSAGKAFAAGLILSLCLAKFHLFLLLPLWMVAQSRWRTLGGLVVGGMSILAVSFIGAGLHWPVQYINSVLRAGVSPAVYAMPNIRGLLDGFPAANRLEWCLSAVIAITCWFVFRRAHPWAGFAAALSGGLLLSHHAYLADSALLLPAALLTLCSSATAAARAAAWPLLLPFVYARPSIGFGPIYIVVPLAAIAFVAVLAMECFRRPRVRPHAGGLP